MPENYRRSNKVQWSSMYRNRKNDMHLKRRVAFLAAVVEFLLLRIELMIVHFSSFALNNEGGALFHLSSV